MAGQPHRAVEVGAGTGIATRALLSRGVAVTCVEPDPAMAAQLLRRHTDGAIPEVVGQPFEQWRPPADRVELLVCALSWHWIDEDRRVDLAHAALRPAGAGTPGGTLAVLDHRHFLVDPDLDDAVHEIYLLVAPQLCERGTRRIEAEELPGQLADDGRCHDIQTHRASADRDLTPAGYVDLLATFSSHIQLAPARRRLLHERIAAVCEEYGEPVVQRTSALLVLARRS